MSRSKIDDPRSRTLHIRVSREEYEKLKSFSDSTGESVSDILRYSAFEYIDKCRSGRLVSDKDAHDILAAHVGLPATASDHEITEKMLFDHGMRLPKSKNASD